MKPNYQGNKLIGVVLENKNEPFRVRMFSYNFELVDFTFFAEKKCTDTYNELSVVLFFVLWHARCHQLFLKLLFSYNFSFL